MPGETYRRADEMAKERLGFIGLGVMGMPMVINMLAAGYQVSVWGRTKDKLKEAFDAGATWVDSPKALAQASDVVILCVWDDKAVEEVVFGPNGIAQAATPDKLLVDHTTIHPERARELGARLKKETGMSWLDAPVSGGEVGVRNKTLIIMAGGDEKDVQRYQPVAATTSQRLTHMGPAGSGQATKVVNQMIIGAEVAVIAEALAFASKYGLKCAAIPDALEGGWADSPVLQNHARRMIKSEYPTAGNQALMLKDIGIAEDLGTKTGVEMPITRMVGDLYRELERRGFGGKGQIGLMWLYAQKPL
jgi:3-hydroxyisobutyrate dehydrogenase